MWRCNFNNIHALAYFQKRIGQPLIFYEEDSDKNLQSQYLEPMREDNVWFALGTGGDAAWMSQVLQSPKGEETYLCSEYV